jgi:hypothetical protein
MQLQDLLDSVPQAYRRQFTRFIQQGELDADFEHAINTIPELQAAVDRALDAQAAQLGPATAFRAEDLKTEVQPGEASPVAATSASLAGAVESALELPTDEQNQVLDQVREALARRGNLAQIAAFMHNLVP